MANIIYEGFEQGFGAEYPAAITWLGIRMPLQYETRFLRHFRATDQLLPHQTEMVISRFVDGSASVTLPQLEAEWSAWTAPDRMDFCCSLDDLQLLEQPDLPAMVRFIVHHATPDELVSVASSVGRICRPDEVFELLLVALRNSAIGKTSNIIQAIAQTRHPEAEATLRRHLQTVWSTRSLWDDASFVNWTAFDAMMCIYYLLRLGASPAELEDFVRNLSEHACSGNRERCCKYFAQYYSWLSKPEDRSAV
jgi:hypothetical protein